MLDGVQAVRAALRRTEAGGRVHDSASPGRRARTRTSQARRPLANGAAPRTRASTVAPAGSRAAQRCRREGRRSNGGRRERRRATGRGRRRRADAGRPDGVAQRRQAEAAATGRSGQDRRRRRAKPPPAARPGRTAADAGRLGRAGRRRAGASCGGGSPATTRWTSSASTPSSPTASSIRCCGLLYQQYFRVEVHGVENLPADGLGAGRRQPLRHRAAGRADAIDRRPRRDPAAPAPAAARRRPGLPRAGAVRAGPQGRRRRWPATRTPSGCCATASRRRVPRGFQGHRQAVPRPVQAAALRPRRLRLGRAAHRHPDRAGGHRRRRGDLPDDRQHQAAGPGDRPARTSRSRRRSRGSGRWACCRCRASG